MPFSSITPGTRCHSLLCLLVLLQLACPLSAQSFSDEEVMINRTLRFVFLPGGQSQKLYYPSNKNWVELELESLGLSQSLQYKGPALLRLYNTIPTEESPASPIAEINLKESADQTLLLFVPNDRSGLYHIYPIKDGPQNFPVQSVLFVNLTRNELAGAFGDATGSVQPGHYGVIHFDNKTSTRLQIRMAVRERTNGDWKLVYSSTIPSRGQHRRWLVIYIGGPQGALIYPDFVSR